jgi:hypothetical protein
MGYILHSIGLNLSALVVLNYPPATMIQIMGDAPAAALIDPSPAISIPKCA